MKKLVLALPLLLAACVSAPQMAAIATPAVVPHEYVKEIQVICMNSGPLLSAAAHPGNAKIVVETAIDAAAYCGQLTAGVVPPTTDTNTKSWLTKVTAALPGLLQVAGALIK